ncbi:uncharacterized protein LOC121856916 isoform X2 [Homarus americanus]|uniref:uncharacterized protein LOC121856916 isoform X2 n=1 Tax=Homarus americanus TaxID=6706 RepID=UPI001C48FAD3|nr:uncharacterized protein LOC121856916 isoform X2 [Homarus americanus]
MQVRLKPAKKMNLVMLLLVVGCLFTLAHAHEAFFGSCPKVTPLPDFDMERFEGLWYVTESFDEREKCRTWNITKGVVNGTWYLREAKGAGVLSNVGLSDSKLTTATLWPDPNTPAKMVVQWPLNIAGSYDFTVHTTDYERFAGVFQCQQVVFFQRQNGIVLSRTSQLWVELQQMARLHHKDVKVEYFKPVKQSHCGYDREVSNEGAGSSDPGPLGTYKNSKEEEDVEGRVPEKLFIPL